MFEYSLTCYKIIQYKKSQMNVKFLNCKSVRNKQLLISPFRVIQWNLDLNEVAGDRPNLFVKWRVRYIENLYITNLRENDQNVRYIEVIVND